MGLEVSSKICTAPGDDEPDEETERCRRRTIVDDSSERCPQQHVGPKLTVPFPERYSSTELASRDKSERSDTFKKVATENDTNTRARAEVDSNRKRSAIQYSLIFDIRVNQFNEKEKK